MFCDRLLISSLICINMPSSLDLGLFLYSNNSIIKLNGLKTKIPWKWYRNGWKRSQCPKKRFERASESLVVLKTTLKITGKSGWDNIQRDGGLNHRWTHELGICLIKYRHIRNIVADICNSYKWKVNCFSVWKCNFVKTKSLMCFVWKSDC